MSHHMTEPAQHCARKRHRCTWCWEFIEPGDQYKRYRAYSDGDASTIKMHPECLEVMEDEAREEGGWIEWIPGRERPKASA